MGPVGRLLLLAGVIGALVLAVVGLLHYAMREPEPSPEDAARMVRLNGVWRSRGYGWLWTIEAGRIDVYDESGPYCIARPDVRRRVKDLDERFDLSADGRRLRLSLWDPAYRFTFDKIEALPKACAHAPVSTPAAVVAALGDIFAAHYAFFKVRKVDWPGLVAAAKRTIAADTSEEDLLQQIGALLAHIDDGHVTLVAKIDGKRFECDPGQAHMLRQTDVATCKVATGTDGPVAQLQHDVWAREEADDLLGDTSRTTANGNIKYGLIGDDIGFLSLLSMEDFDADGDADAAALDAALDEAMALFEDAKAVIVDVSVNDGGEDVLARRIAARFAAKRTLAYSKFAGDAPGATPQAIYLEPSSGPRYTGPVYLMTSNVTLSAAEIFTLAMRALPNVTHVGQATRGALSDVLSKRLPNGWRVTLSNEIYLDADGKAWEGLGIAPQLSLPVFTRETDAAASHEKAVQALVERIR